MKRKTYNTYRDSFTRGKRYGLRCFVCNKNDHVHSLGTEYRVERYKFNHNGHKGFSRRIVFCAPCWQNIAGDEYTMEW